MAQGFWTTEKIVHDENTGKLLTNGTWVCQLSMECHYSLRIKYIFWNILNTELLSFAFLFSNKCKGLQSS